MLKIIIITLGITFSLSGNSRTKKLNCSEYINYTYVVEFNKDEAQKYERNNNKQYLTIFMQNSGDGNTASQMAMCAYLEFGIVKVKEKFTCAGERNFRVYRCRTNDPENHKAKNKNGNYNITVSERLNLANQLFTVIPIHRNDTFLSIQNFENYKVDEKYRKLELKDDILQTTLENQDNIRKNTSDINYLKGEAL